MFRWYQDAVLCYAYLQDATGPEDFTWSEWFTRGWTLQELLAPSEVFFFDREWIYIGSKKGLAGPIRRRSGIPTKILTKDADMRSTSTSQRMAWAADRRTTRKEDIAYCLLGIFDVNMPLLYGEGDKASKDCSRR